MENLRISSKGQTLVLVALLLALLLAFAGLAVDVGMAYGVKAKLNAAVDAAAIAAGRVVSQGETEVKKQAVYFFNANYPSGLLGTTVKDNDITATAAQNLADGAWTITVSAKANVPTNFAKVVGFPEFTVAATATSTVRTLDLMLVLDSSASLDEAHSPGTPDLLRSAAINFISNFDAASVRIGLVHFASGVLTDAPLAQTRGANGKYYDQQALNRIIRNIKFIGATTTEEAMREAKAQLDLIPAASQHSLRAIVLFTDGAPNGIAGNFDGAPTKPAVLYSLEGSRYIYHLGDQSNLFPGSYGITIPENTDYTGTVNLKSDLNPQTRGLELESGRIKNSECNTNRAARNMLENVANAARSEHQDKDGNTVTPIHIFTIGLGTAMVTQEVAGCYGTDSKELGAYILRRVANIPGVDTYSSSQPTGLYVYARNASDLQNAFDQVANVILHLSK
jgi:Flp pilus assembly protein TadG